MVKGNLIKISVIVGIALFIFLPSFAKYQELSYKSRMLDNKIKAMKLEIKRLENERVRLQTDIAYVEKRAREKIGVARTGEIVLKSSPKK